MSFFTDSNGDPRGASLVVALLGFIIALGLIIAALPFGTVGAGERGVRLHFGAPVGIVQQGLYFRMPFVERIVKVDVRTQKLEIEKSQAYSKDLQVVDIHSVLNYAVDPQAVTNVYSQYNLDYESKVISPNLEAAIKQTIAQYSAEELLSKRNEVQSKIEETVKADIPKDFVVSGYALVNEDFSDAFEQAIEQKQVAQQNAEKAENELKTSQIQAQQRIAQAKGEAEAIAIQAQAITSQGGADYVKLKAIEKWDGRLPTNFVPGSAVPFINLNQ